MSARAWRRVLLALSALALGACSTTPVPQLLEARPVALSSAGAIAPAAREPYQEGRVHLAKGRLGLALEQFRRALMLEGQNVRTFNAIAIAYDELGRFDLSERYYRAALALDPDSAQTLNNFGRSLLRRGRPAQARAALERAHSVAPGQGVIEQNLTLARAQSARPLPARDPVLLAGRPAPAAMAGPRIERTGLHESLLRTRSRGASVARVAALLPAAAPTTAKPRRPATFEVANGTGRRHMAARIARYVGGHGLAVNRLFNADHYAYRKSLILFRPGFRSAARALQALLPVEVAMEESDAPRRDVHLTLGADLLPFDARLLEADEAG